MRIIASQVFLVLFLLLFSSAMAATVSYEQLKPIYRLYNHNNGEHLYTPNKNEYYDLGLLGWRQEKVGFYLGIAASQDGNIVTLPWMVSVHA